MIEALLSKTALKIYALLAVFLTMWYGVSSYNRWVSEDAVVKNDAHWATEFSGLTQKVTELTSKIKSDQVAARTAAAEAVAKETERANNATQKYHAELAKNKAMAAKLTSANNSDLIGSLLNSARPIGDGGGSELTSLRTYTNDLGTRYAGCERDLEAAIGEAAKAVDRAATAEAGIRALKKE